MSQQNENLQGTKSTIEYLSPITQGRRPNRYDLSDKQVTTIGAAYGFIAISISVLFFYYFQPHNDDIILTILSIPIALLIGLAAWLRNWQSTLLGAIVGVFHLPLLWVVAMAFLCAIGMIK